MPSRLEGGTTTTGMDVQTSVGTNMESLLRENRVFPPDAEFSAKAHIKSLEEYEAMYRRSVEEPEAFWAEAAGELEWLGRGSGCWTVGWARRGGLLAAS